MASDNLFVARDVLAAYYVAHPYRSGEKAVGILVQDHQGTDAVWALEEKTVVDLQAVLAGGLSDVSKKTLTNLSRTDVVSSWSVQEDEETGRQVVHVTLYGHVSCKIPLHEADSAIQMLDTVLHAQEHKELGD